MSKGCKKSDYKYNINIFTDKYNIFYNRNIHQKFIDSEGVYLECI